MGFDSDTSTTVELKLDGLQFKAYIEAALTWLKANQQLVNSLNVFPVPDGDTGTNMVLTMQSAYNEISASQEHNVGKMAHLLAQGALMGARGNSGVILSQLWRGFARGLDTSETADAKMIATAIEEARNTAYKGVVKPVEGTILTVATDIARKAQEIVTVNANPEILMEEVVKAADESVRHTPELLPILKQAGVVDSGGKGLYVILEGILRAVKKQSLEAPVATIQPLSALNLDDTLEAVEPGQDYEVVVDFKPTNPLNLEAFYNDLSNIGTSIQVGEGDGFYRMHIHVPKEKKYEPIDYTMTLGTITKVAMENLMAQMDEQQAGKAEALNLAKVDPDHIAVVAVSPGPGLSKIFASLGAAAIVDGGQTMNPSTEEILKAFEDMPTDKIIILPNNKNIILAAQTAASVSVKNVTVIPSKNIPQGLSAILHLIPDGNLESVVKDMNAALTDVEAGEITTAIRTVQINDVNVNEGQVICMHNGQLICAADTLNDAVFKFLESAETQDHEQITLFYGADMNKTDVDQVVEKIKAEYPDQEVEVHSGGQPHYQFIISVE
jgi:DAK2 domain fusion protein YloV